jgi:TonB family protein
VHTTGEACTRLHTVPPLPAKEMPVKRTMLFLLILIAGCSPIQQTQTPIRPPELVRSAPLPSFVPVQPGGEMRITVMILVRTDGSVGDVNLVRSSSDPGWDSLALGSIKHWQFNPGMRDGKPTEVWLRQPLRVQFRESMVMNLEGLISLTESAADSLYSLLTRGANFDTLFFYALQDGGNRRTSVGPVDVSMYAKTLREELQRLTVGAVTRPLRVGTTFIIFKRLKT